MTLRIRETILLRSSPQEDRGLDSPAIGSVGAFNTLAAKYIVAPNPNERWNWSRRSRPSRTAHRNTHAISTAPLPDSRRIFCFVRIMRISVALAVIGLAQCVLAEDNFPVVLFEAKDAEGRRIEFRTDTKTLSAAPQWAIAGDGHDEPPLSIAAASKVARDAALRRFPAAEGISFEALELLRRPVSYAGGTLMPAFYVLSVTPIFPTGRASIRIATQIKMVVLMDGTLLEPIFVK